MNCNLLPTRIISKSARCSNWHSVSLWPCSCGDQINLFKQSLQHNICLHHQCILKQASAFINIKPCCEYGKVLNNIFRSKGTGILRYRYHKVYKPWSGRIRNHFGLAHRYGRSRFGIFPTIDSESDFKFSLNLSNEPLVRYGTHKWTKWTTRLIRYNTVHGTYSTCDTKTIQIYTCFFEKNHTGTAEKK